MDTHTFMNYWTRFYRSKMGKAVLILTPLVALIYLPLFTSWGNRIIQPIVQTKLSDNFSTPITVDTFSLSHNHFFITFHDSLTNSVSAQGRFSLLTLRLNAHYRIECAASGGINPLKHPFKTHGALSGGISSFVIHGNTDIFEGESIYEIELHRFHFANLKLKLSNIAYDPLMRELDYPSSTDTRIFADADLRGFDRRDVTGSIDLHSKTKRFTHLPIKEDDNTSFDIRTLLEDQYGRVKPFDVDLKIRADVEHAGILEQFSTIALNGPIPLKAELKGDESLMEFKITSTIAHGESLLTVAIPNLNPSNVSFVVRNAEAKDLFTLFTLPSPILGSCSGSGDFNATEGSFTLSLAEAETIPQTLKQHYRLTQPYIHFNASLNAKINPTSVHYQGVFDSDLSRMEFDTTTTHDQMLRELLRTIP